MQLLSDLISSTKQALNADGQKIDDGVILEEAAKEAERQIIENAVRYEKNYSFDRNDAQLIVLLTIAVYNGLLEIEQNPTSRTIIKHGLDVCIESLNAMDRKLVDSVRK